MRRDPVQGSQDDQQREGPEIIRPTPQDVLPQHVPRPGKKRLDRKENAPPVGMGKTVSQLVGKIPHRQSPGRGLLSAAVAILPPQFLAAILASSAHVRMYLARPPANLRRKGSVFPPNREIRTRRIKYAYPAIKRSYRRPGSKPPPKAYFCCEIKTEYPT